MSSANAILSVRVTPSERDPLLATAELAHTNLSEFVCHKALEAPEMDVFDRRIVTIPAEDLGEVRELGRRVRQEGGRFAELAETRPAWRD
jgi:uncharacterized protein (DUF1778 family)